MTLDKILIEFRFISGNLKENARHASTVVGVTKNEQTDKAFDEAIEKLLTFEKEHGIEQ